LRKTSLVSQRSPSNILGDPSSLPFTFFVGLSVGTLYIFLDPPSCSFFPSFFSLRGHYFPYDQFFAKPHFLGGGKSFVDFGDGIHKYSLPSLFLFPAIFSLTLPFRPKPGELLFLLCILFPLGLEPLPYIETYQFSFQGFWRALFFFLPLVISPTTRSSPWGKEVVFPLSLLFIAYFPSDPPTTFG